MSLPGLDLGRIVEERGAVVALEEVLAGAALDPVVATVAEHGVGTLTGVDEVIARAGERLVVVRAAEQEVVAFVAHRDVVAGAGVDGVVAGATLGDVGTVEVGDDVVALAAESDVVAAVALDAVVARAAPEGVVVVAADDAVDAVGAVVDGLAVDAGRIDGVALPCTGSCRRAGGTAAGSRRSPCVDGSSATAEPWSVKPAGVPSRLASWNLQSAVPKASALSVLVPVVFRMMISENELPSSWVRRFMPGVRFR